MKWLFLFSFFLSSCSADEPGIVKVGIVDTGIHLRDRELRKSMCKSGHDDFTGTGLQDTNGHGSFVAKLIQKYAKEAKYCLVICKFWDDRVPNGNAGAIVGCFNKLAQEGVSIINFSGGGPMRIKEEEEFIAEHPHITFVVAAGNSGVDMDKKEKYYPACLQLDNVIAIGSLDKQGLPSDFSNYGLIVDDWELGEFEQGNGTSFACAVHTGKMIYENYSK